MPASEKRLYHQFEVSAGPESRWRRWTLFPLYFQAFKPRFRLCVKKISNDRDDPKELRFYVEFADKASVDFIVDVSHLSIGNDLKATTPPILLSPTGDARICLDTGMHLKGRTFLTLYSFVVSAEATLVFLLLNVALAAVIAILLRL